MSLEEAGVISQLKRLR